MGARALAIIPARGGSKRIPRKNIMNFRGRPMIGWSIEAAKQSGAFSNIVVSTDDTEIAEIACREGAEVPFIRPPELADDHAGTLPVIQHAIQTLEKAGQNYDYVCCIYPAAPLVQASDIQDGYRLVCEGWNYAFTTTSFASSIFRSFVATPEGGVQMLFPEHRLTRTQDLPEALHDAGQFYWGRIAAWLAGGDLFGPLSAPIQLPRWRVQDIDTLEDLENAGKIFDALSGRRRDG